MSQWPAIKAKRLLAALLRLGWQVKRKTGSHKVRMGPGWPDFVFAFHTAEEIGPRMLARSARHTGLITARILRSRHSYIHVQRTSLYIGHRSLHTQLPWATTPANHCLASQRRRVLFDLGDGGKLRWAVGFQYP